MTMNSPKDTQFKAEKKWISLVKEQRTSKKISLVRSLSQTVMQLSKRAIARANPNMNEDLMDLIFIDLHYGEELAKKVERYKNRQKT